MQRTAIVLAGLGLVALVAGLLLVPDLVRSLRPAPEPAEVIELPPPRTVPPVAAEVRGDAAVVANALRWLAAHQSPDGAWDGDVATTGLAVLAFLGGGHTHKHGAYKRNVKNGLRYLKQHQRADGRFADGALAHGIAARAMREAFELTGSPLFKASAFRAEEAGDPWPELTFDPGPLPGQGRFDPLHWHVGTLSAYGAGGPTWQRWRAALRGPLHTMQRPDGSFGDAAATANLAVCAEVYYRYPRVHSIQVR